MSGIRMPFGLIAEGTKAVKRLGPSEGEVCGVSTDTRSLTPGQLFLALQGPNFDGHDYLGAALEAGATGLVISDETALAKISAFHQQPAIFIVGNTLTALGDLAAKWRDHLNPTVAAITGSNGKTTSKELLSSILGREGRVLKTEGNLNNLIGLPLTLLKLSDESLAVVEMGMSELHEIERMAAIARPKVGLITNVNPAHLESMGDMETIARAKGELFAALGANDIAVVNQDDPHIRKLAAGCRAEKITFSLEDKTADVYATDIIAGVDGFKVEFLVRDTRLQTDLPLHGRHNVMNMLGAAAAAAALGIEPQGMPAGIAACTVPGRRLKVRRDVDNILLIDDCYNANPSSTEAALNLLAELGADRRRVAILGDMLELGDESTTYHREIGRKAVSVGVDCLINYGQYAEDIAAGAMDAGLDKGSCLATDHWPQMEEWISSRVREEDVVLVKGSRGVRMERAINIMDGATREVVE